MRRYYVSTLYSPNGERGHSAAGIQLQSCPSCHPILLLNRLTRSPRPPGPVQPHPLADSRRHSPSELEPELAAAQHAATAAAEADESALALRAVASRIKLIAPIREPASRLVPAGSCR
ncbi:hypothetical protein SAMD00023353_4100660 [Rosellinia necatrix]|uniref:Uncharacterized protein n=1 Tax=Rosellinia necatrix TaxID=77044 RepID=A0A1W2TNA4_ROSNE|nr:hypothetical protein SAMD00023353_4100660 [Rosellinia necatrix]